MSEVTRYLPRRHLSRWVGKLVYWQGPRWLVSWIIWGFAKVYQINLNESEHFYWQYPSLGDFFIRRLKSGLRPLASTWAIHPADSEITQAGPILEGQLVQAKGVLYSLNALLADEQAQSIFKAGHFFTYYLCPTDYHRVHSPVTGEVISITHIPGDLWPVNQWSTTFIPQIFCQNERVVVSIQTDRGLVAAVFVGATNVGSIALSFDSTLTTNAHDDQQILHKKYSPPVTVQKGQELGLFRMGSTVVMIYSEEVKKSGSENWLHLQNGTTQRVKVNSAI